MARRSAALLCALATCCASSTTSVLALQTAVSASSSANDATVGATNATITAAAGDLIGWFDCSAVTFADELENVARSGTKVSSLPTAQCARYKAPLCHTGICEDVKKRTIDVFFKRIQAKSEPATKPSVWFLPGGPGTASSTMEIAMTSLYRELEGNVNVYTMDHRGTGRSTLLDCVAAQATTSGSPEKRVVTVDEVAACAQELELKFGKDLSAFSVTSAATDIASFIAKYQPGSKTYVYGVSYGSMLVERLIHLNTTEIVGYILDGVATTSGAAVSDGMYMSNWDVNFGEVADRFLDLCAKDNMCASNFPSKSVQDTLAFLVDPTTTKAYCYDMVTRSSASFRLLLARLLLHETTRGLIPAAVFRTARCTPELDGPVVSTFGSTVSRLNMAQSEDQALNSTLLHHLIVFSEMWEDPTPSYDTLMSRYENASMSTGPIAPMLKLYCTFTKSNATVCSGYASSSSYTAAPIAYKKDKYWNVAATIPPQASVLILSGKLDPQTPHKYAERLFKAMDGAKKELVAFEYAAHGVLSNTALPNAQVGDATCGMSILVSFVKGGGDLSQLDKTCVSALTMSFAVPKAVSLLIFNASEPFNGKYDSSYWSSQYETRPKYITTFVVVSVATGLMLLAVMYLCFRHKKRKAAAAASATKTTTPVEIEGDDDGITVHSPTTSSGQYTAAAEGPRV